MEFRDYYATLGVPKTASEKEIKQAFRRLARKHHPDVNPGDSSSEARFKEVTEAYEVLGTPETRRKYDELGANWKAYEQAGRGGGQDPFRAGGGGGGWSFDMGGAPGSGYRQVSPDEMKDLFGDANPFSDFFKTFFGGPAAGAPGTTGGAGSRPRTHARRATRQPGTQPQEHEVTISLEEAYYGASRRVTLTGPEGPPRSIEVRFPAGIRDGQKVRAPSGAGDVFFRVRIAPHDRVERRGDHDLTVRVVIPIPTAVLGGEAEVTPLVGRPLRVRIPPGTGPGRSLRVRGQGMPVVGSETRGDLIVTLDVQVPSTLSPEERQHYEALAALAGGAQTRPA
jgi:curved DNA-binding protein